ncbi:MAG: polysaccharide biosynthesis tyrosine autokinase [Methylacidiphilales bacterium]|nr:polysaccharide biosynthesis tyrosine autokinase [Candidatus Methylacidiphilales bacterium]MDW8349161.1 polysaccharide biosynthesis tyrosine autokinase [Verrucomicrobiae bacterium]
MDFQEVSFGHSPPQPPGVFLTRFLTRLYRFRALLKKYWWIVLLALTVSILVGAILIVTSKPIYISSGKMMVAPRVNIPESMVYTEEYQNFFGTQMNLMRSAKVLQNARDRLQSTMPDLKQSSARLEVGIIPRSSIFQLNAISEDKDYVQHFLSAVMEEFINLKKQMRSDTASTTLESISQEIRRVERELQAGDDELRNFQRDNNVVALEEQAANASKQLVELTNQLSQLKKEYDLLDKLSVQQNIERKQRAQAGAMDSEDKKTLSEALASSERQYAETKTEMQMLEAEVNALSEYLRPQHPKLIQLQEEIRRKQKLLEIFEKQTLEDAESRKKSIEIQIENLKENIKQAEERNLHLSERLAEYNRLKSRVERLQQTHSRLLQSIQNVGMAQSVEQETVTILENASPPYEQPKKVVQTAVISVITGLVIGLGLIMLIDRFDDRINSLTELQELFRENIAGQIPKVEVGPDERIDLLKQKDERHVFAEAYRNIRSSLIYMPVQGQRPRRIVVTSAIPGDGKSTVSANLAITMAFAGSKVLLVDSDLRRGCQHQIFGIRGTPGFSEILRQETHWDRAIIQTSVTNLYIIPCGQMPAQPGELLLSPLVSLFIREVENHFDYILFDSAPIMATDDTSSLAPKTDGVLFVLRAGYTNARLVRAALDVLYQRQVPVLGLIFNGVDTNLPEYYYYKYSEYYRSYSVA